MPSLFIILHVLQVIILLKLIQIPLYLSSNEGCENLFNCGTIKQIGFPFWGGDRPKECGHPLLNLICTNNISYITINEIKYHVLEANPYEHTLRITNEDYLQGLCPTKLVNTTLDTDLFVYGPDYNNLILFYGCPPSIPFPSNGRFSCHSNGYSDEYVYTWFGSNFGSQAFSCRESMVVPVLNSLIDVRDLTRIQSAIGGGFVVKWIAGIDDCEKCQKSGGFCGYNWISRQTTCYCGDQSCSNQSPQSQESPSSGKSSSNAAIIGGVVAGVAAVLICILGFACFVVRRRRKNAQKSRSNDLFMPPSSTASGTNTGTLTSTTNSSQSIPSYPSSKSTTMPKSFYFGVQVFTYEELEEATNNFHTSKELGEGGFGTVYKGDLKDGRVVAVKRHYESNFKRVAQFMNEVEILARLRHKNLVTLYGCTSKHSRELLLVYEFIPNGTVADHLHGDRSSSSLLPWSVRLDIALETAEALAYLHASDVMHRDVKSNNILLDEKFHVKVADFGLSRLFPNDVTHVSTAPQGTPGYVDPEYYQCYQLTDKSDVYSFGVVLVELISSLQAVDITRHRNDVNLANMAVNKIQSQELYELVDPNLGYEKDNSVRRMTTAVAELAFRCLQQQRDLRPSMDEIVEILRAIKSDELETQESKVLDVVVRTDELVLLKKGPCPTSPDSVADKWVSGSSTSTSS